ncbi:hypothetical protein PLICRDRAFT_38129 [Plicaturopsis crispa FD-325 SS-3]|nr:hypothetical protein PLICRDRAFT_38129 [Plicaturopsis crispa FD-325 SS-3]
MSTKTVSARMASKQRLATKPRKSLHPVDTNLHSYDRTDPFAAFNVLLKLLGTLPSRIGGCQYKLSPDEHKLCMGLLTIVEPFVSLAPSKRTLTRQPAEILDAITFFVDSKRDLLSLALSCRRMHAIVCPRHMDYRVVRAKASNVAVWNHLIVHRSLARNVRVLEVLDERSTEAPVVPKGIVASDTDLESTDDELTMHSKQERFLVSALGRMSALQSFTWSCNHSPISIDDVWPTLLAKCASLATIDIRDNLVFNKLIEAGEEDNATKRRSVFPALKSVSLQSTKSAYGAAKHPELGRVAHMLDFAPHIETLSINYTQSRTGAIGTVSPRADNLLLLARYPRLTTLALTNLTLTSAHPPAAFLAAHPFLEVLHLDIAVPSTKPGLVLPADSLPRLRELQCARDVATAVLSTPCASPRPLETLKGVALRGAAADAPFLASLRAGGASVRRIELARGGWADIDDVRRLAECAPGVRWLDVGPSRRAPKNNSTTSMTSTNVTEWAGVLGLMPELGAFHGVKFFYAVNASAAVSAEGAMGASERSRMRKNDEAAGVLGRRCAKLRRVDYWEDGTNRVILLVREDERGGEKGRVGWEVRKARA